MKELKNILYAEDEDDIRTIAQVALEDIGGFQVHYCCNGKDVLDALKNYQPDLFLFDVMMPQMDGPTTLEVLRKNPQFQHIPAIFMTAKIQEQEMEKYKSLGAIDVVVKPFDPLLLAQTIKAAWMKYHG